MTQKGKLGNPKESFLCMVPEVSACVCSVWRRKACRDVIVLFTVSVKPTLIAHHHLELHARHGRQSTLERDLEIIMHCKLSFLPASAQGRSRHKRQ